jgi:hypothetical protein
MRKDLASRRPGPDPGRRGPRAWDRPVPTGSESHGAHPEPTCVRFAPITIPILRLAGLTRYEADKPGR